MAAIRFSEALKRHPNLALAINAGQIMGVTNIDKYGENPAVATGVPADVWEYGGLYTYDADGTDPIRYISSSDAGDVGHTITVAGLDINGYEVNQTATTNGQNVVTLDTPLWRVYRMQNDSGPTPGDLAGLLYCHTDATPTDGVPAAGTVRALINNGNNQTLMAIYTVPRGKVGFLFEGEVGCGLSGAVGTTSEYARMSYQSRRYGKIFKVKKRVQCSLNGSSNYQDARAFPDIIPALTDIAIRAEYVSDDMNAWATFDILLVDEEELGKPLLQAIGQPFI